MPLGDLADRRDSNNGCCPATIGATATRGATANRGGTILPMQSPTDELRVEHESSTPSSSTGRKNSCSEKLLPSTDKRSGCSDQRQQLLQGSSCGSEQPHQRGHSRGSYGALASLSASRKRDLGAEEVLLHQDQQGKQVG